MPAKRAASPSFESPDIRRGVRTEAASPSVQTSNHAVVWNLVAGDISQLALKRLNNIRSPTEHQVTVDVKACGLNFADVFACLNLYSATPSGEFTPGLEFSGVIAAIGTGVKNVKIGDRVFGVTRFGGYATRLVVDSCYVRPLQTGWTFEQGAAYAAQALTAFYGLVKLGDVKKGQSVLIHSAAGGTGLWAVKICQKLGAHVVGTVGSASKVKSLQELTGLPTNCIIDRSKCNSKQDCLDALKRAAAINGSYKFDVVFDSLMGDWYDPSHESVARMGRHVVLGAGAMTPPNPSLTFKDKLVLGYQYLTRPKVDVLNMISENKSVMAFNLIWLYEMTDIVSDIFDELAKTTEGMGPPHVGDAIDFLYAPVALKRLQGGDTIGKVVLSVSSTAVAWTPAA